MAQMIAALFDSREDAKRAVHALEDHGVDSSAISVLAVADDGSGKMSNLDESERVEPPGKDGGISTTTAGDAEKGAAEGAAIGAGLGVLAALASIFVPGFGLITAGGALASAIGGAVGTAVGGAITGGVAGYLADMGVPGHAAHHYSEGIKKGGVLVSVHDTDEATPDEIQQIFTKYNGHSAGSYAGVNLSGSSVSNPDALDATNRTPDVGVADRTSTGQATVGSTHPSPTDETVSGATRPAGGPERTYDVTGTNTINTAGRTSAMASGSAAGAAGAGAAAVTDAVVQGEDLATAPRGGGERVDTVAGSEGSASSRLSDAVVGPNPDHIGAATDSLSVPTTTPRGGTTDVGRNPSATAGTISSFAAPAPLVVDEDDEQT